MGRLQWNKKNRSLTFHPCGQITDPNGQYIINEKTISNGDYSIVAGTNGKHNYCFGNQHWGANSKEVSFNVHGVVYVSESEYNQDPLESEGA